MEVTLRPICYLASGILRDDSPITWPRSSGQLPLPYDYHPSGRGYDYYDMPFAPGLLTEICPEPKLCRSAAVSETWSVVPLTKVVGRAAPLYNTTEFASNPLPLTVM